MTPQEKTTLIDSLIEHDKGFVNITRIKLIAEEEENIVGSTEGLEFFGVFDVTGETLEEWLDILIVKSKAYGQHFEAWHINQLRDFISNFELDPTTKAKALGDAVTGLCLNLCFESILNASDCFKLEVSADVLHTSAEGLVDGTAVRDTMFSMVAYSFIGPKVSEEEEETKEVACDFKFVDHDQT